MGESWRDSIVGLPPDSAVVVRHYHLALQDRYTFCQTIVRLARPMGHKVIWAGDPRTARRLGADGHYGPPEFSARIAGQLRVLTVHTMHQLGAAQRNGADYVMLSPVFETRSHPGARTLGSTGFATLAQHANVPVIALGGVNSGNWGRIAHSADGWAAIDGLTKNYRAGNYKTEKP